MNRVMKCSSLIYKIYENRISGHVLKNQMLEELYTFLKLVAPMLFKVTTGLSQSLKFSCPNIRFHLLAIFVLEKLFHGTKT